MLFTKGGSGNKVVGNEDDGKGGDSIDSFCPKKCPEKCQKCPEAGAIFGCILIQLKTRSCPEKAPKIGLSLLLRVF